MMAIPGVFLPGFRKLLFTSRNFLPRLQGIYPDTELKQSIHDDSSKSTVPPAPKRPIMPYFQYFKDVYHDVRKQMPDIKSSMITVQIAQNWKQLQPEQKEKYNKLYKKEKEKYDAEALKWKNDLTPAQQNEYLETKQKLKLLRGDKKRNRAKRKIKKELEKLGKPKKPASPFVMFSMQRGHELKIKSLQLILKKCGEEWHKLSDEEKLPLYEKAKKEMEQYKKDLSAWENSMKKMGHSDVLGLLNSVQKRASSAKLRRKSTVKKARIKLAKPKKPSKVEKATKEE